MTTAGLFIAGLRHRRLRSLVSLLCVTIASAMLLVTVAAITRIRSSVSQFDSKSIMIRPRLGWTVPYALVGKIHSLFGDSVDIEWNTGFDVDDQSKGVSYEVYAPSSEYFSTYSTAILTIDAATHQRWLADRQGMIVPAALLSNLGWKVGDTVTLPSEIGAIQAHIVGTSAGAFKSTPFLHYEYADSLRAEKGTLANIVVRPHDDPAVVMAKLETALAASDPPVLVLKERAFQQRVLAMSGTIPALLEKVTWLFGLSTLLVILTNVIATLRERRPEFGALRAIGFTRLRVVVLVLGEAAVLALIATALGCGIPFLLYHEQGLRLGAQALESVTLDGFLCLRVMLLEVVIICAASLLPAISLAMRDTISLLEDR